MSFSKQKDKTEPSVEIAHIRMAASDTAAQLEDTHKAAADISVEAKDTGNPAGDTCTEPNDTDQAAGHTGSDAENNSNASSATSGEAENNEAAGDIPAMPNGTIQYSGSAAQVALDQSTGRYKRFFKKHGKKVKDAIANGFESVCAALRPKPFYPPRPRNWNTPPHPYGGYNIYAFKTESQKALEKAEEDDRKAVEAAWEASLGIPMSDEMFAFIQGS